VHQSGSGRATSIRRRIGEDLFGVRLAGSGALHHGAEPKRFRPPVRRGLQWRLISPLALNYLSSSTAACPPLQEILKLYDFTEDQPYKGRS